MLYDIGMNFVYLNSKIDYYILKYIFVVILFIYYVYTLFKNSI